MNGNNYDSIQAAMSAASTTETNIMILYQNIVLTSNITVPDGATITVNKQSYTIDKNGFNFVGNDITIEDTNGNNLLAMIRDLLNLGSIKVNKNIAVFNDDNGDLLDSAEEYTLKMKVNGSYEKIDVIEHNNIGKYEVSTVDSDTKIRTIDGNVYLYKMSEGDYILEGDSGSTSTFTINEDGSLNGNVRTVFIDKDYMTSGNLLASSQADMIVNIKTGNNVIKYSLITIILGLVTFIMILIKKKVRN